MACYIPHFSLPGTFIKSNSAYKKYHSTETLLTRIKSDIHINMDNQEIFLLLLLDLSAAFDTVDIDKLLKILRYGYK